MVGHPKEFDGKIIDLNEDTFDSRTYALDTIWFVKFYTPWGGHCRHLAPKWKKFAEKMKGTNIFVARVDGTKNLKLKDRFGVKGFPTLILFSENKQAVYAGERSVEGFEKFAKGEWKKNFSLRAEEPTPTPSMFLIWTIAIGGVVVVLGCVVLIVWCTGDEDEFAQYQTPMDDKKDITSLRKAEKIHLKMTDPKQD